VQCFTDEKKLIARVYTPMSENILPTFSWLELIGFDLQFIDQSAAITLGICPSFWAL